MFHELALEFSYYHSTNGPNKILFKIFFSVSGVNVLLL